MSFVSSDDSESIVSFHSAASHNSVLEAEILDCLNMNPQSEYSVLRRELSNFGSSAGSSGLQQATPDMPAKKTREGATFDRKEVEHTLSELLADVKKAMIKWFRCQITC